MVLNLYAEGKIQNLPVLTVEDGDNGPCLVINYYNTDVMARLKAYPTVEQLSDAMPDDIPGLIEQGGNLLMEDVAPMPVTLPPVGGDDA